MPIHVSNVMYISNKKLSFLFNRKGNDDNIYVKVVIITNTVLPLLLLSLIVL